MGYSINKYTVTTIIQSQGPIQEQIILSDISNIDDVNVLEISYRPSNTTMNYIKDNVTYKLTHGTYNTLDIEISNYDTNYSSFDIIAIISVSSSNSELENIRIPENGQVGETYSTAGDSVRGQIRGINLKIDQNGILNLVKEHPGSIIVNNN